MDRDQVVATLCALKAAVGTHVFKSVHSYDCICNDPTPFFSHTDHTLQWIRDAIEEKCAKDGVRIILPTFNRADVEG